MTEELQAKIKNLINSLVKIIYIYSGSVRMYSFILEELKNWKKELESSRLNEYDITVANIILKDYEQLINAGGRASGKRISKFVELVNQRQKKLNMKI